MQRRSLPELSPMSPVSKPPADYPVGESLSIDVCICTFRRATLADTLSSLDRQVGGPRRFRVIIADNDETPSALALVKAFRAAAFDIQYIHAPARNISTARNACLDAVTADYVAWIDDDETAEPDWLAKLSAPFATGAFDAVFGVVKADYPQNAPRWAVEADLHSTAPVTTARGVETGYTSNAMVRRATIGATRFDVSLGRSGGEDTDFFTRLHEGGARFAAAPGSIVREIAAPGRLRLSWLTQRSFRAGQTHARRFLGRGLPVRAGQLTIALFKGLACAALVALSIADAALWRRACVRAALHFGVGARLMGIRDTQIY